MSNVDSINVDESIADVLNAANPASGVDQAVGADPLINGGGTELTVAPTVDKAPGRSSISTRAAISLNGAQSRSALTALRNSECIDECVKGAAVEQ